MAGKTTGTDTPVVPEATANPEPPASPVEPVNQDNEILKQLEEARSRLADLATTSERLEKEKNDAIANALRADAMYKGLQFQTTKTLQKAAEDRRALAQAQLQAAEIGDIKSLLNTLASKVLDEDEAKQLQYSQKDLELKRREAALTAKVTEPVEEPVATPQQYTTPEDEKAQFLSYYFPGVDVDPKDPNIDWGVGATSTQDAFRRFTTSVLKISNTKDQAKTNDAVSVARQQADEQLAAIKKAQDELVAKTKEDIEVAKNAAIEEARKEAEKRLRAMGADVSGTPPSDGSRRTIAQTLTEQLDDNMLRTKDGAKEYNRQLEAVKQRVKEQFR